MLQFKRLLLNGAVVAVLATLSVWVILESLTPILKDTPPVHLFLAAVMLATWAGGLGAGILATVLSALVSAYFLIEPHQSLLIIEVSKQLHVLLFVLAGGSLSLIIAFLREIQARALAEATRQRERLEQEIAKREQIELALKSAHTEAMTEKNRLEAVMQALPIGLSILDAEGGNPQSNRAFAQIWGGALPAVRSVNDYAAFKAWWAETGQPVRSEEWASARAVREGETIVGQLIEISRFDGSRAFVHNSAAPIRDATGQIAGSAVAIMDITERIRIERALRESEERFHAFMSNSPAIAWIKDSHGRHVYLNKTYENRFGVQLDDWRGRTDFELWPRETAEQFWKNDQAVLARGGPLEIVEQTPGCNGRPNFWLNFKFPIQDASGNQYVAGIGIDITERQQAEEALRQAKQELEHRIVEHEHAERKRLQLETTLTKIVATAPGVLCSYRLRQNGSACFPYASPAIREIYGLPPEALTEDAAPIFPLIHPDDMEHIHATVAESARELSPWHCEWRVRHPDKGEIWVEGRSIPEREPDGGILWHGFIHEITERKRVEKSLKEADRRKNEFLAMLGHELRNPLAPIRNAVQILKSQNPADSNLAWSVHVIDRQVGHLARLLDDLLDVARIMQGRIMLKTKSVDLIEIIDSAVETCRPLVEARKQILSVSHPATPQWIEGDPVRLTQTLSNLLNNAAKYTPEGGKISLKMVRDDHEGVITVEDTGVGICPEILPHIFDLFTQADRSLAHAQGGLGIGLTLAQRLVEMHGGTITASSEGLGRGSEFTVRLPLIPSERPMTGPPSQVQVASSPARLRVLVVDDYADAAESLGVLLRSIGHEVAVAEGGLEAIERASALQPQVVLLDIGLPDLDGYEVAKRLRELPETQQAVLIALTGYGQPEDRERSKAAGFDHHLLKPVDLDVLSALLASATGEQKPQAQESAGR